MEADARLYHLFIHIAPYSQRSNCAFRNSERNGNLAHTLLTVTRAEAPIHHSGTLNLISKCVFAEINRHFYLGNKSFILHSFALLSDVVYLMTFTREAEKMCENTIQAKNYSSSDGLIYGFVLTTECVFTFPMDTGTESNNVKHAQHFCYDTYSHQTCAHLNWLTFFKLLC